MSRELAQEIWLQARAGAPECNCCAHVADLGEGLLQDLANNERELADLRAECARLRGEVYRLSESVRVAKIMLEVSK